MIAQCNLLPFNSLFLFILTESITTWSLNIFFLFIIVVSPFFYIHNKDHNCLNSQ
ncbi:predicted protein [Enterococcus faecium 1,141,733]|nr:predicted protein [Enterococcus faecium 1,141,733]